MILDEKVYLEHVGTKGMRWGVRKKRDRSKEPSTIARKNRKDKKADKKAAKEKADKEYGDAVSKLVRDAASKGSLVQVRVGNRSQIMTGQEAVDMIIQSNGRIPRNAMWNQLELDRK